jgi:hypothetical protein
MAYGIKNQKRKVNYSEKEIKALKNKNSYPNIFRSETRIAFKVPEKTHQENNIIKYNEELYAIKKVTNKGVYVAKVSEDKDGFLDVENKQKFISEKQLQEGKAYPYYPLISWGFV